MLIVAIAFLLVVSVAALAAATGGSAGLNLVPPTTTAVRPVKSNIA